MYMFVCACVCVYIYIDRWIHIIPECVKLLKIGSLYMYVYIYVCTCVIPEYV